ncbi:MAG: putative Acyltransferase family protein [Sphingomonadales bacterium]|nr:putative Acyltransferase family protein [Sphingomonadales bacterium]
MTKQLSEGNSPAWVRTQPSTERAHGVDAGRLFMAFLVACLHSRAGNGVGTADAANAILGMVCRAAVPFFLITSGYFLNIPPKFSTQMIVKPLIRLLPVYVFWMTISYIYVYYTHALPLKFSIRDLVSGGSAFHLWYLPALGVSLVFVSLGVTFLGRRALGIILSIFAFQVIVFGAYHDVFNMAGDALRGGLFIAPLFVFIGYMLARQKVILSTSMAAVISLIGLAIILVEEMVISYYADAPLTSHDFTIGTLVYGVGVFLFARSLQETRRLISVAKFGRYAFGIYLSHLLFVWTFGFCFIQRPVPIVLLIAMMSFVCAASLTMAMFRIPYLRKVVG